MPEFKDTTGRRWSVAINIAVAKKVRDRTSVDLVAQDLTKVLQDTFADHILLCDVLYVIADANAEPAQRISDEEFGRSMSGDSIEEGGIALLHALRDFTPNPRARARVGRMVESVLRAMATVHEDADRWLDEALKKLETEISGARSSDSQASPASSPGPTASES